MLPFNIAGNLLVIGLGIGLVMARVGRLGPFGGKLGSPWLESDLNEALVREMARASRYERQLTVIAIRLNRHESVDLEERLRLVDRLFRCRDDWAVALFPETNTDSALRLLRRLEAELDHGIQAAVIAPGSGEDWTSQQIGDRLASIIKEPPKSSGIAVVPTSTSSSATAAG